MQRERKILSVKMIDKKKIPQFDNRRIAKNTVALYVRMLFLVIVSLYSSRVVLHALGIVDFGIVNVVGGLATLFVFFRSSLSNISQRYLTIEIGRDNKEGVARIFTLHFTIYIIIAIITIFVAEVIGYWFIVNKLVIPQERLSAALWVFHFMVIGLAVTILSVVYDSLLIAHENIKIYTVVGVVEGSMKLVIAVLIENALCDKMILYQGLLLFVAICVFIYYANYCKKHYEECRVKLYWEKQKVRESFSLVSWNALSSIIWLVNEEGINILINLFFGPVINAARAISYQVSSHINSFGNNLLVAIQPQMVKSYAIGDSEKMLNLFYSGSKYSSFMLWIFILPMVLCIDLILKLWLYEVPEHTSSITIWVLIFHFLNNLFLPIQMLLIAAGKLKRYVLIGGSSFLMACPIAYFLLRMGAEPEIAFVCVVVARIIFGVISFLILQKYIKISLVDYSKKVILPICIVVLLTLITGLLLCAIFVESLLNDIFIVVFVTIINGMTIYLFGLNKIERKTVGQFIKKYINVNGGNL